MNSQPSQSLQQEAEASEPPLSQAPSSTKEETKSVPSRKSSFLNAAAAAQLNPQLLHKTRNSSIISFTSSSEIKHPSIISKPPPGEDYISNVTPLRNSYCEGYTRAHDGIVDENLYPNNNDVASGMPRVQSASKTSASPAIRSSTPGMLPSGVPENFAYSDDPNSPNFKRKSSISFTEPKAHAERTRSVNQLYQHIAQHMSIHHHSRNSGVSSASAPGSTRNSLMVPSAQQQQQPVNVASSNTVTNDTSTDNTNTKNNSGTVTPKQTFPSGSDSFTSASSKAIPKSSRPPYSSLLSPECTTKPTTTSAQTSSYAASVANSRNNSQHKQKHLSDSIIASSNPKTLNISPVSTYHNNPTIASNLHTGIESKADTSFAKKASPGSNANTLEQDSSKSSKVPSNISIPGTDGTPPTKRSEVTGSADSLPPDSPYYEHAFRRNSRISIIVPPSSRNSSISGQSPPKLPPTTHSPADPTSAAPKSTQRSPSPSIPSDSPVPKLSSVQISTPAPTTSQKPTSNIPTPLSISPEPTPPVTSSSTTTSNRHSMALQSNEEDYHKIHILIAVTGSVATIKIPLIISKLRQIFGKYAVIQLIVTASAQHFLNTVKIPAGIKVWQDSDEWSSRRGAGSEASQQLHVQLRRWADILLIAPLSANTLAKMANGICDNLITSVFRAWNPKTPIIVAPAMNTHMYTNPMTKKHLDVLKNYYPYVHVLKPVEKVLVCGDIGMGGMREWTDVVDHLVRHLGGPPQIDEDDDEDEDEDDEEARAKRKLKKQLKKQKKLELLRQSRKSSDDQTALKSNVVYEQDLGGLKDGGYIHHGSTFDTQLDDEEDDISFSDSSDSDDDSDSDSEDGLSHDDSDLSAHTSPSGLSDEKYHQSKINDHKANSTQQGLKPVKPPLNRSHTAEL